MLNYQRIALSSQGDGRSKPERISASCNDVENLLGDHVPHGFLHGFSTSLLLHPRVIYVAFFGNGVPQRCGNFYGSRNGL